MSSQVEEYFSDAQTAERLKVTTRTTMRWRRDGVGPAYIRAGVRRVLYSRAAVDAWTAERSFPHRAAEANAGK